MSMTAMQVTCQLPNTAMAGVRTVNVNISPLGYASGAVNATVQVRKGDRTLTERKPSWGGRHTT